MGYPGRDLQGEVPEAVVLEVDEPPIHSAMNSSKTWPPRTPSFPPRRAFHHYFDDLVYLPARKLKLFCANSFPELFGLSKEFDPEH